MIRETSYEGVFCYGPRDCEHTLEYILRRLPPPPESMVRATRQCLLVVSILSVLSGCGGSANNDDGYYSDFDDPQPSAPANNTSGQAPPENNEPPPETEEFLVRQVATTSSYVFVPNGSDNSQTVARIDGRDFGVVPLRVGLRPTVVRAAEVEGQGAIAYVLCEGDSTLAIIRADELGQDGKTRGRVSLLKVPREVNAIEMAPDGKHLIAYIDPDRPLLSETSVASVQTMALIRLGDAAGEDEVFQLSVTRLIRDIEFSEDGSQVFVVGREGINRIRFDEVTRDAFVPPLQIESLADVVAPSDYEVEVSPAADFLVIRATSFDGVALIELNDGELGRARTIKLPTPPTDIDLITPEGPVESQLVITSRADRTIYVAGVEDALSTPADEKVLLETIPVDVLSGLSQLTPDRKQALIYSTIDELPELGVLSLGDKQLRTFPLLNQIRALAVTPDSLTGVVIHTRQEGTPAAGSSAQAAFRYAHGLTLIDLMSGYRRPIELGGEPVDFVLTEKESGGAVLYTMITAPVLGVQGVVRVDLSSFRVDTISLPREPRQLGVVAGKVFVSQGTREGRITFLDVDTNAQRTVSGYELNAGID